MEKNSKKKEYRGTDALDGNTQNVTILRSAEKEENTGKIPDLEGIGAEVSKTQREKHRRKVYNFKTSREQGVAFSLLLASSAGSFEINAFHAVAVTRCFPSYLPVFWLKLTINTLKQIIMNS